MAELFGFDAYSPQEIADRAEQAGVAKARLPFIPALMLSILAGGFIGLGAMYFTLVTSDASLPFALSRLLGGVVFSLGLILVVVAGAELFTGNNLLVIAWADKKISTREMLLNWLVVFIGNAIGAIGLALLIALSHHLDMNQSAVSQQALKIALHKVSLPFWEAFFKGMLCNILVCLAVWLALAGRSVTDKILAIVFPISAFVAAGFEHSIANLYFIPLGMIIKWQGGMANESLTSLDLYGLAANLVPVTLGNILGGSVMVALVYHLIYHRNSSRSH